MREAVERARTEVYRLNAALVTHGLVAWTSGNGSARVPGEAGSTDLMVIKPSGIEYPDLAPDSMVVCDLDGTKVDGAYKPSSDTASHAYVYRHMPQVGGVVHTHSTYATAWAARGEAIPCVITAMADEFGGGDPPRPVSRLRGGGEGAGGRGPPPPGAPAPPPPARPRGGGGGRGGGEGGSRPPERPPGPAGGGPEPPGGPPGPPPAPAGTPRNTASATGGRPATSHRSGGESWPQASPAAVCASGSS